MARTPFSDYEHPDTNMVSLGDILRSALDQKESEKSDAIRRLESLSLSLRMVGLHDGATIITNALKDMEN